ncbi:mechanosensitive ion channel family protein [Cytophagaceae bacterium ABcell3]|nr:mechanosensitive ion channel family protein [Cytophagaceae bacterium ABcell3]
MSDIYNSDDVTGYFLRVIFIFSILIATYLCAAVVRKILTRFFDNNSLLLKADPTQYKFLKHLISALIYLIGVGVAIYSIPALRSLSLSLFTGAGIFAAIIGFASQQAFSNIVSGIFIVIFKPFRVDDRLEIRGNITGVVEDITLRHTVLRNFENRRVIIPNSVIGQEVIYNANITDERTCRLMDFMVGGESNIDHAIQVIQEEALAHPELIDMRKDEEKELGAPIVAVRVMGFGEASIHLRAFVWAKNPPSAFILSADLNKAIKQRFDREGIRFPAYNQTNVRILEKQETPLAQSGSVD